LFSLTSVSRASVRIAYDPGDRLTLVDYDNKARALDLAPAGNGVALTAQPARNADEVCVYVLAECDQSYSPSGAAKLMRRLGFAYTKPQLPAQADEAKQAAFTVDDEVDRGLLVRPWTRLQYHAVASARQG
jgi:hypothetical protein